MEIWWSLRDALTIMGNEDHVVGIYSPKRSETITDNGKERYQDVVDDVDHVILLRTNRDPTDEEEDPSKTEQGDQSSVERNEESEGSTNISTESLHTSLELRTTRVQHVADMVVQPIDIFLTPAFEGSAVWKDRIVGVLQVRCDAECASRPRSLPLFLCQIFFGDFVERIGIGPRCGSRGK